MDSSTVEFKRIWQCYPLFVELLPGFRFTHEYVILNLLYAYHSYFCMNPCSEITLNIYIWLIRQIWCTEHDSKAVTLIKFNLRFKVCYPGWAEAYSGYLMAGHPNQHATEYICMDARPEPEPHTQENKDGHLYYFVEGRCGSLPCLPYVNGRELACVVCTK
jgi:hypothetical protein